MPPSALSTIDEKAIPKNIPVDSQASADPLLFVHHNGMFNKMKRAEQNTLRRKLEAAMQKNA